MTGMADPAFSSGRVKRDTAILIVGGAALELFLGRSVWGATSLSFSGVVAIINFHWLEALVARVVQPGKPQYGGATLIRALLPMSLLGGVLAALVWLPKVDARAVLLGFSTLVVALFAEAFRWALKGGDAS